MAAKYALHPGPVTMRETGAVEDVDAITLAQRYGVDMADCIIWDDERRASDRYGAYTHLFPKASGDYKLPK